MELVGKWRTVHYEKPCNLSCSADITRIRKIKETEISMPRTWNMHVRDEKCIQNLQWRDNLGDLGADGRIILKYI
jgi:hypothetical protein